MSNDTIFELRDIKKSYRLGSVLVEALRGLDLSVRRGEFTVIHGPSGSGKSTLFNIVGCLDRADAGSYTLDGEDISDRSFNALADIRNYKIGFIFQTFNLIPVLNITENIEFPCLIRSPRENPKKLRERAQTLAEELGLTPYLRHRPDELSGGQRQRVAIARALITEPRLVLADEPTANLDSETANHILTLMKNMNTTHGTTFLFATHDPKIKTLAGRCLNLRDGRITDA